MIYFSFFIFFNWKQSIHIQHTYSKWLSSLYTTISMYLFWPVPYFVGADHEIQRQNRITEQILTNFLERKLFPNRRPQQKAPTIDEILPAYVDEPANSTKTRNKHSTLQPDDDELSLSEQDALQSVESEHVDSFYQDRDDEGRSLGIRGVGIF